MNYEFKSEMASDMNGLIEIKVATHHCESTYLDRAKSFDSFCAEHYPDADLVTQSRTLKRINVDLNSGEIRIVNSKWNRTLICGQ